jgi:hypothetical protein
VRREGLKNLMLTELAPANEGTKDNGASGKLASFVIFLDRGG